jgi:cyclophilin family peptidyl-prolyl cis-trans isomerase
MARTRAVDSATAQFFINVVDNGRKLDYKGPDDFGYTVFGKVVEGMEIADRIKDLPTGACPPLFKEDCPATPVVIESARRLK